LIAINRPSDAIRSPSIKQALHLLDSTKEALGKRRRRRRRRKTMQQFKRMSDER
jgi:hypothetical protein